MTTSIHTALLMAVKKLKKQHPDSAELDAEILMTKILNQPKEFIFTRPEYQLNDKQLTNYQKLITRRLQHEPVAYLTGTKEFYGLNFYVNRSVLIPRPETEWLVDYITDYLQKTNQNNLTIYDIGTGSGCIAISLKKYLPTAKITAIDVSKRALNIAKKNAQSNKVKINFIYGDLLKSISQSTAIDIVVANLPYLKPQEITINTKYEPKKALDGGQDGLKYYKKLLEQVVNLKQCPQVLLFEISPPQTKKIIALFQKYLPENSTVAKKDLALKNRFIISTRQHKHSK